MMAAGYQALSAGKRGVSVHVPSSQALPLAVELPLSVFLLVCYEPDNMCLSFSAPS
jgi:hypothetical protein